MGQLTIAGVTYSNPRQIDQTTNMDPQTNAVWQPKGFPAVGTIGNKPNGTQLMGTGGPQPGSYDATAPTAPPVAFNQPAVSASDLSVGGKAILNGGSWKNPA